MKYFCDVHIQAKKDAERRIFIVFENNGTGIPNLTKEILIANNQYKDFVSTHKPKLVYAEYAVYSTEEAVFANTSDEEFISCIELKKVKLVANAELSIDSTRDKIKKRRKSPFAFKIIVGLGVLIIVCTGFLVGLKVGSSKFSSQTTESNNTDNALEVNEDGMIIPEQMEISDDSQQITISIDRSYSAIPKEDLQLKGTVIDGAAEITLPEFDRTDFFTHVPGYTWGFSTDPTAKRIEYYGGMTYAFKADTKLYRILVKYGGGNGTKDDPYLINYYDQFELMGEEKARGYFKQISDISFPDWLNHVPIDTVNELKSDPDSEIFEYDGNGYTISNLSNPLFGKVSGAVIKNVNIKNSEIKSQEYKYYGMIVCEAYNYQYTKNSQKYETGETLIKNCTIYHSGITIDYPKTDDDEKVNVVTAPNVIPPDLIEYDEDGNIINTPESSAPTVKGEYAIGAISGIGGQIEDCYVTDFGISVGIDKRFLYVGGISGKPANVINSAVYFYSAKGNIFNAGGIAGNAGGSRYYDPAGKELPYYYGGNIQGCVARKIIIKSEVAAGGLVGEAASDAECPMISNCYTSELNLSSGIYDKDNIIKKSGITGGIIGVDGKEKNGHYITNTVSDVSYTAVGNTVSKSKYDDSIRLAPAYAFNQENILTVINKNSIHPDKPKHIFTGSFTFGGGIFNNEAGALPYPESIKELINKLNENESE